MIGVIESTVAQSGWPRTQLEESRNNDRPTRSIFILTNPSNITEVKRALAEFNANPPPSALAFQFIIVGRNISTTGALPASLSDLSPSQLSSAPLINNPVLSSIHVENWENVHATTDWQSIFKEEVIRSDGKALQQLILAVAAVLMKGDRRGSDQPLILIVRKRKGVSSYNAEVLYAVPPDCTKAMLIDRTAVYYNEIVKLLHSGMAER